MKLRDIIAWFSIGLNFIIIYLIGTELLLPVKFQFNFLYTLHFDVILNQLVFVVLEMEDRRITILQWYLLLIFVLQAISLNIIKPPPSQRQEYRENRIELYPTTETLEKSRKGSIVMKYRILLLLQFSYILIEIMEVRGGPRIEMFLILIGNEIILPLLLLFLMFIRNYKWITIILMSIAMIYILSLITPW